MEISKTLYDIRMRLSSNPFAVDALDMIKLELERMSISDLDVFLKNFIDGPRQCGKSLSRHGIFLMALDARERKLKEKVNSISQQALFSQERFPWNR